MISSSQSLHLNVDHKRRDDLSDNLFTSENEDEVWPLALSTENDLGLLKNEDSLFQDDLKVPATDSGIEIAQQDSSCGKSLGRRDVVSEDDLISSKSILPFFYMFTSKVK